MAEVVGLYTMTSKVNLVRQISMMLQPSVIVKKEEALKGGGDKRIESQHSKGKLTARERIDQLLD